MPRLALNKTQLTRESKQLETYERFLPSLDLKRRQLIAERNKARRDVVTLRDEIEEIERSCGSGLPMAANERLKLDNIVTVRRVELAEENLVGLRLPILVDAEINRVGYEFLARPHWIDALGDLLEKLLKMKLGLQVLEQRLAILELAVKKTTQRVNLFDKVLIPRTRDNIRRIGIQLSDAEKAAVVNAKIAKRKRAAR
jgi:V/A-type H+-transporting ATPase subunit D